LPRRSIAPRPFLHETDNGWEFGITREKEGCRLSHRESNSPQQVQSVRREAAYIAC